MPAGAGSLLFGEAGQYLYRICSVAHTQTLQRAGQIPPGAAGARWFGVAYFGLDMLLGMESGFIFPEGAALSDGAYCSPENLTEAARLKGAEGNKRQAAENENNRRATSMINLMRSAGKNYNEIAAELNRAGFQTARGGQFQPMQVKRLAERSG